MQKVAMISQPVANLSKAEFSDQWHRAIDFLTVKGYEIYNTYIEDSYFSKELLEKEGIKHKTIYLISLSLDTMARCDTVYFCNGWEKSSTCVLEHEVAKANNMNIIYERVEDL